MSFLRDRKGQLLTLDLLLALVPLTIILGMSASAMGGVINQIQEYSYIYSMQRVANDAVDVLVKTPGAPSNWNSTSAPTTIGLADYSCNTTTPNLLDYNKISATDATKLSTILGGVANYYFEVVNLNTSSVVKSVWSNTTSIENASNVFIVERIVNLGGNGSSTITEEYDETNIKKDTIEWDIVLPSCVEISNISMRVTTSGLDGDYLIFEMDKPPAPVDPNKNNQRLFIGANLTDFSWDDAYNDPSWTKWQDAEKYVKQQGNNHSRYPTTTLDTFLRDNLVSGLNRIEIKLEVKKETGGAGSGADRRADLNAILNITHEIPAPIEGRVTLKTWR